MSDDPFEQQERYPSVSWKNAKVGTVVSGEVIEPPREVQARDFETGEPAYWEGGDKKMTVVVALQLKDGDKVSLWCPRPSSIFAAVAQAQKDAGERIQIGGTLKVKFTGEEENKKNPRLNARKLFKAKYEPPDSFAMNEKADPEPEPAPTKEAETASDDFGDDEEVPF